MDRLMPNPGERRERVQPEVYRRVFVFNPEGKKILEEWVAEYVYADIASPDAMKVQYELGKRDLILDILGYLQVEEENNNG